MSSAAIVEVFSSIQGEGPLVGERQLFIRFCGCNRSCAYCDTEAARQPTVNCRIEETPGLGDFFERPNPLSPEELIAVVGKATRQPSLHHSVALTGGEPLLHAGFLLEVLPRVSEWIPVLLETNGTLYEALSTVLPWVEIVSMDVKLPSATGEPADWESHRLFLQAGLGTDLYVKAVVSPGVTDREVERLVDLVAAQEPEPPLILQPMSGTGGDRAWARRLLRLQAFCRESLGSVRVIPQVHKMLDIP